MEASETRSPIVPPGRRARGRLPVLAGAALAALAACSTHAPRRAAYDGAVDTSVAHLAEPGERELVGSRSAEIHPGFGIAFVEFDDQGRLWDLDQLALLDRTLAEEARRPDTEGVGIVVFVHGWYHDASVCDPFVACFRSLLERIAQENAAAARLAGKKPIRLVGVYCGWRGRSSTIPVLSSFTFWGRKKTAERIGGGELVAVFSHLDRFVARERAAGGVAALSIVGHSFGGTAVFSALSNVLKTRLVEALEERGHGPQSAPVVRGFGDLVVLVNPAFEASAYAPLHDLVDEIGTFSPRQTPVLVVVGSETDFPNRTWFPLGRSFDVAGQRTGPRSPRTLLTTSVGSYDPFTTHRLDSAAPPAAGALKTRVAGCGCTLPMTDLSDDELARLAEFFRSGRFDGLRPAASQEACEAGVTLGSAKLRCLPGVSPLRPICSVRAADAVIHGHAGFFTRPFLDFLRYVILDSISRSTDGQ